MSWRSKVVWSEGMFLQPQHFQQQDRYLEALIDLRSAPLRPYGWGFSHLVIDDQLLAQGKLAVQSARGILPDGTPFSIPGNDPPPEPLELPEGARDLQVILALPLARAGMAESDVSGSGEQLTRFRPIEVEVRDSSTANVAGGVPLQVGALRLRLVTLREVTDAYAHLAVATVVERRSDRQLVLDTDFIPPCLAYRCSHRLAAFVDLVRGILHQRADALAGFLSQPGATGVAEVSDFMRLQLINRYEPLFDHLAELPGLHPEELYRITIQLAGEYSTLVRASRRPAPMPPYRHDRLRECFLPLIEELRALLSHEDLGRAIALRLEERRHGVRVAVVPDPGLLKTGTFVMAVKAQVPAESVRTGFPASSKIGPPEKIAQLVNLQLPGIGLRPLPVVPRQLPFHAGFTYFELDRASEYWAELSRSGSFAVFVATEALPGLELEFWAIRGQNS